MRVLLAQPRVDCIGHAAEDFLVEAPAALVGAGFTVKRLPGRAMRKLGVDVARELAGYHAVNEGLDWILFGDADARISAPDTVRLLMTAIQEGWAFLGAPMAGRNGAARVFPWPEGSGWQKDPERALAFRAALRAGVALPAVTVDTAVSVVSVKALEAMGRPWFLRHFDPSFLDKWEMPWDDAWFSSRAREAGQKIGVHLGILSGEHWDGERCWLAKDALAALDRALAEVPCPK